MNCTVVAWARETWSLIPFGELGVICCVCKKTIGKILKEKKGVDEDCSLWDWEILFQEVDRQELSWPFTVY